MPHLPANILFENAGKAEAMLKLLANRHRLMILCSLVDGSKNVSELIEITNLSQSSLSQHLARLRQDNMVHTNRKGQNIYYSLSDPKISALLSTLYLIYCHPDNKN